MRRPANIFFLAVVIGLLSAAMVYRHLRTQEDELEQARNSSRGATVDVMVAGENIPIGSRIEARQVKAVHWPMEAQPPGALNDVDHVVGRIARNGIVLNQPILDSQLVTDASGLLPLLIDQGMRGMSVKVDNVTGVSGFITPNSRVDVLASGSLQGGEQNEQRSKVILQNIRVLAVGTTIEMQDNKPVEVPTVTLLVSPEDAEKLTLASRHEPVRLALRNFRDEDQVTTTGATARELFAMEERPRVVDGYRRPAPPARPSVEVLLGETRTKQEY
jgi:pilus assembly protein CpaB